LAPFLLAHFSEEQDAIRILLIAGGSTLAAVVVSWWTGPEPLPALRAFYARVRPPGFWAPVAGLAGEAEGESTGRLVRGLAVTAAAALSVFSLLTGVGSWLIDSPPPTWFAWRNLWIGFLLCLGVGLSPLWISRLIKGAGDRSV
jgi:solute:Na+ symporter, SSS family